jgi:hypothetical protein
MRTRRSFFAFGAAALVVGGCNAILGTFEVAPDAGAIAAEAGGDTGTADASVDAVAADAVADVLDAGPPPDAYTAEPCSPPNSAVVVYPGDPCTQGPDGKPFNAVGACSAGAWACVDFGTGKRTAACLGAKGPTNEVCTPSGATPADEDCDGTIDEGCQCTAGATRPCGQGDCTGTQSCSGGVWGACSGTQPGKPDCRGTGDRDCNGVTDRTQVECLPCRGSNQSPVAPKNDFGSVAYKGGTAKLVGCGGDVQQSTADGLCRSEDAYNLACEFAPVELFLGLGNLSKPLAGDYWTSEVLYAPAISVGCNLQANKPLTTKCDDGRLCAASGSRCALRPCSYAGGANLGCGSDTRGGAGALCVCR